MFTTTLPSSSSKLTPSLLRAALDLRTGELHSPAGPSTLPELISSLVCCRNVLLTEKDARIKPFLLGMNSGWVLNRYRFLN